MKSRLYFIVLFLLLNGAVKAQCRDTITEKFGTSIHTLEIGKDYSGIYELILTSPTIEPQSLTLIIK